MGDRQEECINQLTSNKAESGVCFVPPDTELGQLAGDASRPRGASGQRKSPRRLINSSPPMPCHFPYHKGKHTTKYTLQRVKLIPAFSHYFPMQQFSVETINRYKLILWWRLGLPSLLRSLLLCLWNGFSGFSVLDKTCISNLTSCLAPVLNSFLHEAKSPLVECRGSHPHQRFAPLASKQCMSVARIGSASLALQKQASPS